MKKRNKMLDHNCQGDELDLMEAIAVNRKYIKKEINGHCSECGKYSSKEERKKLAREIEKKIAILMRNPSAEDDPIIKALEDLLQIIKK